MSSYLETEVRESQGEERLAHVAHLSIWALAPKLLLGVLLLVVAIAAFVLWPTSEPNGIEPFAVVGGLALLAAIPLGSALVTFYTTEIGVTDRRVLYKIGLVRRRTFEMVLEKVESLWIDQSLLGRVLRYGTIRIAAASDENIVIAAVAEPVVLKRVIDETKNSRLERFTGVTSTATTTSAAVTVDA